MIKKLKFWNNKKSLSKISLKHWMKLKMIIEYNKLIQKENHNKIKCFWIKLK